jgi:tRNA pseudouridine55 synthase
VSVSGILIVDKPAGMTSHDVVARVRRRLQTKKVGHAGTLDPNVTGVLVLCIGDATRLIEFVTADEKEYEGTICFGYSTDTDDADGRVLATASAAALTEAAVQASAASFVGSIEQTVPRYSAVHIAGRRAYEYAREGAEVDLPRRRVEIYELSVSNFRSGERAYVDFRVRCSKGTYIRALARDWGERLGVPAHLHQLRRTASGPFHISEAVPLDQFLESERPEEFVRPSLSALRALDTFRVSETMARRLAFGQAVTITAEKRCGPTVAVLDAEGELVCVAEAKRAEYPKVQLRPRKVFWKRD